MKKLCAVLLIFPFAVSCKKGVDYGVFEKMIEDQNKYRAISGKESKIDFDRYFTDGSIDGVRFKLIKMGEIRVSSGKIVACDPFYVSEKFTSPFKDRFPVGAFGVYLSVADKKDWRARVAFAKIRFGDGKAVTYKVAEFENPDKSFGSEYPVDAGLGCFMDRDTAAAFAEDQRAYYAKNKGGNYYGDRLDDLFRGGDWAVCSLRNGRVFIFSSGYGDGSYASYVGYDARGTIVCLITDFAVTYDE